MQPSGGKMSTAEFETASKKFKFIAFDQKSGVVLAYGQKAIDALYGADIIGPTKTIKTVFADKGYSGANLAGWVAKKFSGAVVQTSANLAQKFKKFVPAKKRWVVERSFA